MTENKKENFMKPDNCLVIAGKFCLVLLFLSGLNCGKDNNNTTIPTIITPPLSTCDNCELLYYGQNRRMPQHLRQAIMKLQSVLRPQKLETWWVKQLKRFIILLWKNLIRLD